MMRFQHVPFLAALAILGLALVAAGCGSTTQSSAPRPTTEAQTVPTVTPPDTPASAPTTPPLATPPPVPTASPTGTPRATDTAAAVAGTLSPAASRIDPEQIITVLPRDAIPAILHPEFVTTEQAAGQMRDDEDVIGVTINGESRAYPVNMLSSHEIVNDTVGGVAIAVTW